jgi:hypothetical protein
MAAVTLYMEAIIKFTKLKPGDITKEKTGHFLNNFL